MVFTLVTAIFGKVIFDLFYRSVSNNCLQRLLLFGNIGGEIETVRILGMRERFRVQTKRCILCYYHEVDFIHLCIIISGIIKI